MTTKVLFRNKPHAAYARLPSLLPAGCCPPRGATTQTSHAPGLPLHAADAPCEHAWCRHTTKIKLHLTKKVPGGVELAAGAFGEDTFFLLKCILNHFVYQTPHPYWSIDIVTVLSNSSKRDDSVAMRRQRTWKPVLRRPVREAGWRSDTETGHSQTDRPAPGETPAPLLRHWLQGDTHRGDRVRGKGVEHNFSGTYLRFSYSITVFFGTFFCIGHFWQNNQIATSTRTPVKVSHVASSREVSECRVLSECLLPFYSAYIWSKMY